MPRIKPVTIDKKTDVQQSRASDFAFLRQQAIAVIQQMAGHEWTDYNLHDPGVTIIEQLCYAITDLAYRTGFSIRDLLTNQNGYINFNKNSFHHRDEILFSGTVTTKDYRKILIDRIEDVDNVWLEPVYSKYTGDGIKGLYKAIVQVNKAAAQRILENGEEALRIKELIRSVFVSERNLGEDLANDIVILKPVPVQIKADVLIRDLAQPEQVLAEIYHIIDDWLSSGVKYFTEEELIKLGYTLDEIYSGPRLTNGIIPDKQLKERRSKVDHIEIIRLISKIDGVLQVKQITIEGNGKQVYNKPLELDKNSFGFIDTNAPPTIRLFTSKYQVQVRQTVFQNLLLKLNAAGDRRFISSFITNQSGLTPGRFRNPGKYFSLQNNFPVIYGIGKEGLPEGDRSDSRLAQVKQLKGYLLLFEQVLANYLAQLANIDESFSAAVPTENETVDFFQPLYNVPGVEQLLRAYKPDTVDRWNREWESFMADKQNGYITALTKLSDKDTEYHQRRNAQLDHMLARFNEMLPHYSVRLYRQVYYPDQPDERFSSEMRWKSFYLSNIVNIHRGENRGFNYLLGPNHSTSFNFEKKMRLLLCLNSLEERRLTDVFNNAQIKIETAEKNPQQPKESASETTAGWIESSADLFLSANEMTDLIYEHKIIKKNNLPDKGIVFNRRNKDIFAAAIDFRNYKIAPDLLYSNEAGFLLLFKYKSDETWEMISRHDTSMDAVGALTRLVNYFRRLSIDSEGFYTIEHILLRPSLETPAFGFQLKTPGNEVLFSSREWVDFKERDEQIDTIIKTAYKKEGNNSLLSIHQYCDINPLHYDLLIERLSRLTYTDTRSENPEYFNKFDMLVKSGETVVNESFFNFQMTVVLPSWPARFQDVNFQEFIKDIFTINVPANIKVNFKWLPPFKMKAFEEDFIAWKEAFRTDAEKKDELSAKLIRFLTT